MKQKSVYVENYWIAPGIAKGETISSNTIIKTVCEYFEINEEEIKSKSRSRSVAFPRQCICYFVKLYIPSAFLERIGDMINRDHSTVLHSIKVVKNLVDTNAKCREMVEAINKKIIIQQA